MSDDAEEPIDESAEAADGVEPAKKAKKVKVPKPPKSPKPPKVKSDKKKGFPWVLVLIPVALAAALVLAFTLPPTHALLVKSPLGPLIARFTHESAKGGKADAKPTADPVADAKRLSTELAAAKAAQTQKDAQIAQLQTQVSQLQTPAKSADAAASPKPSPTAVPDDVKRTATYWAGMDADKAADIIKQLPDTYVKAVFGQMPADAVADIMSALPAKTAARLTTDPAADGSDKP